MKRLLVLVVALLSACTSPAQQQDLYLNAQNSRATADAALYQAQLQEANLTVTSQAPVVRITETAAAMVVQQMYWTVTAQSIQETQNAGFTAIARSWTPTPDATQTAVFSALNAQNTQIANDLERDRLEVQRQQDMNDFKGKLPVYSFVIIVLVLAIALTFVSRREQYRPAPVDERGNILPILNVVDGTYTDIDPNPNYRGDLGENLFRQWLRKTLELPPLLPPITAERQDASKQRDQIMDLAVRGLPASTSTHSAQKRASAQEMTKQLDQVNLAGRFKVLDGQRPDLDILDGQIIEVLNTDWKEAQQQ